MYIVGINSAYHESAACVLHDGKLVAAIEEERLSRRKHGKEAAPETGGDLPLLAIKGCLELAGIELGDVAGVGFSIDPEARLLNQGLPDPVVEDGWGSTTGEQIFYEHLQQVPEKLRDLGMRGEFHFLPHHLCHAASAYYPSPFPEAAVLSVDGIGENQSTIFVHGRGEDMETIGEIRYPSSLGFFWEKFCKFLGFSEYHSCKVMGLASYGDPQKYLDRFDTLVELISEGRFRLDGDLLRFRVEDYEPLEALFGLKRRLKDQPLDQAHQDIAAALQEVTNRVICHMVDHLSDVTGSANLCMAGGVALNCVANRVAFERSSFENLYIQPATHDAGTAVGAALLASHRQPRHEGVRCQMPHAFSGPTFSKEEIESALQQRGLTPIQIDEPERVAAELIASGQIVGWFQGAMEFGPRALGHRSLLADPRQPQMKQLLNNRVKHREEFRPFAPSVLAEEAGNWFHIGKSTQASDFMLLAYPTREDVLHRIPAVVHVDGTSRIQTVRAETSPRYHRLISHFYALTGVPLVLNTSFNDNEPIVCTPADAIETFVTTHIDALIINDLLVQASSHP